MTKDEPLTQPPERYELQSEGKHPAPCARFCEANAFKIEIRSLKSLLEEQSVQQKVPSTIQMLEHCPECGAKAHHFTYLPQRKPLTDEEIAVIAAACGGLASDFVVDVARAIEQAHGITGETK